MIGDPLLPGGENDTLACAFPAAAMPITGAPGTPNGVALADAADGGPVPTSFVAVTVHVYAVPLTSPVTVIGDAAPLALWLPQVAV